MNLNNQKKTRLFKQSISYKVSSTEKVELISFKIYLY